VAFFLEAIVSSALGSRACSSMVFRFFELSRGTDMSPEEERCVVPFPPVLSGGVDQTGNVPLVSMG
jgi:hypothetical protein